MKLFLTIDVECYTGDYEAEVWGDGLGVEFILAELKKAGLKATFFVEALGVTRWGSESTSRICSRILSDGHEVGLHLHSVVADIKGFDDRFDTIWRQDRETQSMLIKKGLEIFKDCGVSNVKSFRAGSLAANEDTIYAMKENGLLIGSNRDLDTKSSIESQLNDWFPIRNDISQREGVIDTPLTCFRSPFPVLDGKYRHLEVSAVGFLETKYILNYMQKFGYKTCTILTHPREFYRKTKLGFAPISKNVERWRLLLSALSSGSISCDVGCVADSAEIALPTESPREVKGSAIYGAVRLIQQFSDRLFPKVLS